MAKEILVRENLTNEMTDAGSDLLPRLDAAGFEVVAAFWLYYSEAEEWRLTLAWPEMNKKGPKNAYERIGKLLDETPENVPTLDLLNITVVSPDNTIVRALASANNLIALSGKRLSGNRLNGIYIEDIYIYFVKDSVKPLPGPRWISK